MSKQVHPRIYLLAGIILLGTAAALPWLLSRGPTEAERRLTEARAWMEKHPPKYHDRSDAEARAAEHHRAAVDLAAQRWYEEILGQHPGFQVEFRDIPDAENGFLQLLEWAEILESGSLLPEEFADMLAGRRDWDRAEFEKWLAANREVFQRLLAIAELPDRSVGGIPISRFAFIPARPAVQGSQLLHAAARIAAESGDLDTAFRYHAASLNLAKHYDGIELPTLLAKTVAILVRTETLEQFHETILPQLHENPQELTRWRALLPAPEDATVEFPRLMTGEWNVTLRQYLLPALIAGEQSWANEIGGKPEPLSIPDPREVIAAYTESIRTTQQWAAGGFTSPQLLPDHTYPHLSEGGQGLLADFFIGAEAWTQGMHRANSQQALHNALLAIALGSEDVPLEPLTGEPFVWNPSALTLSPPAALEALKIEIEPISLPLPSLEWAAE